MEVLDSQIIQLYERRLDNCLFARDRCVEGSWGWKFWQSRFTLLLRRLNIETRTLCKKDLKRFSLPKNIDNSNLAKQCKWFKSLYDSKFYMQD